MASSNFSFGGVLACMCVIRAPVCSHVNGHKQASEAPQLSLQHRWASFFCLAIAPYLEQKVCCRCINCAQWTAALLLIPETCLARLVTHFWEQAILAASVHRLSSWEHWAEPPHPPPTKKKTFSVHPCYRNRPNGGLK